MRIAICDDEMYLREMVQRLCEKYLNKRGIEAELVCFSNGQEVLDYLEPIDILLLDVEMPLMDGFQLAQRYKEEERTTQIIFLTSHTEMMSRGYKVRAFRFLTKPINEADFEEALDDGFLEITRRQENRFHFISEGKNMVLDKMDICYIESMGDSVVIYTQNENYHVSVKLKHCLEQVGEMAFFQTNKSFIVGLEHVKTIDKGVIYLRDGKKVPVSIRRRTKLSEKLNQYIRWMAR